MKNLLLLLFLFLFFGCSKQLERNLNVSNNMTIDEFELKIIDYSLNNPYPNIDD